VDTQALDGGAGFPPGLSSEVGVAEAGTTGETGTTGDARTPRPPDACDRCGGQLIEGTLALPILGRARFAYDLRGRSVETDVDSRMCADCGSLTFTATDPARIRRAHAAIDRLNAGRRGSGALGGIRREPRSG
jgi:hypothetical protein